MGGIQQRTGDTNNYDNGWKKIQTFSIVSVKANGLLKRPLKSLCVLSDCYDVCNPRGLHAVNFTCWPCRIHACFPFMCTAVTTTAGIVICHNYIYMYVHDAMWRKRFLPARCYITYHANKAVIQGFFGKISVGIFCGNVFLLTLHRVD